MKRIWEFVIVLLVVTIIFGFVELSKMWGSKGEIEWGKTFKTTDSTQLRYAVANTDSTDTLYTAAFEITNQHSGVFRIMYNPVTSDAALDSLYLQMRQGFRVAQTDIRWALWYDLLGQAKTDTVYLLNIASADSSWWGPCNIIQFRTFSVDTNGAVATLDTLDPDLSVFLGKEY